MLNGNSARKLKAQTPNTESRRDTVAPNTESFLRRDTVKEPLNVNIDDVFESANETISINILPTNRIELKNQKLAETPLSDASLSIKGKIKNSLSKRLSIVRDNRQNNVTTINKKSNLKLNFV